MVEIVGYELHIKTHHSLGEMLTALKNKGLDVDLEKEHHCDILKIRHSGSNHDFEVKLYERGSGYKIYEVKARTEKEMRMIEEVIKAM